jgi:hypothetical protein
MVRSLFKLNEIEEIPYPIEGKTCRPYSQKENPYSIIKERGQGQR